MIRQTVMLIAALGFGIMASGGVLTVLLSVGIVPRFVHHTGTAGFELWYENMIILGATAGCLMSVFPPDFNMGKVMGSVALIIYGLFSGIFEGCIAIALAEILDALPICERRLMKNGTLKVSGMRPFVTAIALGKFVGSMWYFYHRIFRYGG